MWWMRAWLVLWTAWCARAGPGPPVSITEFELSFEYTLYNLSIPENSPVRTYALSPPGASPPAVRLPSPGARVRFRIKHGDRDKFFKAEERTVGDRCFLLVRTRAGHADVLNRERRDLYHLEVRATAHLPGGRRLEADTALSISVTDENDLSPLFYPTEYEAFVPEDAPLHSSVARVSAEDADLGLNGEIYYSLERSTAADRFAVHLTTGLVTLTRALSIDDGTRYDLVVIAHDRASLLARGESAPSARASLTVRVTRVNLHAPELRVRHQPDLVENTATGVYAIVEVTDRDSGENGHIVGLEIVDGDPDGHFRVRPSAQPGEYDVLVHALLDRESSPRGYNLTLRAIDAGKPPRSSYITLPVTLVDANDNAPVFNRELYEASVPETAPPGTPVIRLKVSDRDEGRNARVYIEIVGGNEGGEFRLNPDTGVLYTAAPLDFERKPSFALTVSALDQGNAGTRKQSSAKVQVTVLDANDNDPVFDRFEVEVALPENGPSGTAVTRVLAKDADAGDNAYVSYSIANLRPVPFEVDHFSGAVRTSRLLDYESMRREYVVRIRAGDWGLPYRRQAELRLTVRLEDVNDNRPQFERVDCVGHLPRKLLVGSEILTLSALDFDAGDVVSYRFAGGNEDGCFALDSGTGVLSLACDLTELRIDSRVLNVTATDGTHFADPTAITLHLMAGNGEPNPPECRDTGIARRLTDLMAAAERANAPLDPADEFPPAPSRYGENLHAPEFLDFPVEVKVNESVALGTPLVRLRARDRDLGYNGLLVFVISGGDTDSAFRVDPNTGELQVIGYLDRERETEYYLNVTAYDLGRPQRTASRLLPVTVLDVNDNPPRFEKSLASFRVTENALNGTEIFRANATDRDAADFGRVSYSMTGADDGEFCLNRESGSLTVCAALDRERRALYELILRATDGGGLHAEAIVRVAIDDINDNAPHFGLPTYAVRVREDVPIGTLVAVIEAFDPDLGAGGVVTYSLPDSDGDATFIIDPVSGTLRTASRLDFETRQVYGLTIRATDGGQPALWTESTVILEVVDVDENMQEPRFREHTVLAGSVREDSIPGTEVLKAPAIDADLVGRDSRLAYTLVGGSGLAHFSVDDMGILRTLTPLDRETEPHYWLTLCAQDHGLVPRHTCIQVYIEVEDVNDVSPWPERPLYSAQLPEHSPPGAHVIHISCIDGDAAPVPPNITYSIVAGNPDGLFSIDDHTGEIVTTGRTLDREAGATHALEVHCSDGELGSAARLIVRLLDVNDHAPIFAQRFYDMRTPAEAQVTTPSLNSVSEDVSAEWDEDEEGTRSTWELCNESPPSGRYVGSVLALDPDEGANGTVRYWSRARGKARSRLRIDATSGRLYADESLLTAGAVFEMAVRACDEGPKPRCAVARVSVRSVPAGGRHAPTLPAPPAIQVTELDAPGFLLAVLQATDPDADPLYYDIVEGDPRREFIVGREDGSLVLGARLLWERQRAYILNVSVSDGQNRAYAVVNVSVINDANEAGVHFTRDEYVVDLSESTRSGEPLLALQAAVPNNSGARILYGIRGSRAPYSAHLFRLHELSGVLELAHPLDRESAHSHELTVFARDGAPRAGVSLARVIIRVQDADEHAPTWGRRLAEVRVLRSAPVGSLVAALRAADADAGESARVRYSLVGDAGPFTIDPDLGDVTLARELPTHGAPDYTVHVRASNPPPASSSSTLPLHVLVVEPDDAPPRFLVGEMSCEVYENAPAGTVLATIEARSPISSWYSLEGGAGLFRLNPASGLLTTVAPLDYEAQNLHELTVTALSLGGGEAQMRVLVHVLDCNEFAPRLIHRDYRGKILETASVGALVSNADGDDPLVLDTEDTDSTAHQLRAFEIFEPDAARLFRIDPTTGALRLLRQLDYEAHRQHRFTVRVLDAGNPRLAADSSSTATVTVDVTDVNDCAPVFSQSTYSGTLLLPTVAGVTVTTLMATDADLGSVLSYDLMEDATDGALELTTTGVLRVVQPDLPVGRYRLRVRASDGEQSAAARVEIEVREIENAGLAFQKADYYGTAVENSSKQATVAVLSVVGAALNEHIEFRILNPDEHFEVGATSGAVRTTSVALDRELRELYALLVEARGESRVARARLHVTVADVNDNCPVFVERPYVAAVLAGAPPGEPVLQVHALDPDANENGEVRYEMKRGNGEVFRVDRRTGQISLKQTVDTFDRLYSLVVGAFDGGSPACGADAEVSVRVWRGGAAPGWERAHYVIEAREDVPPGESLGPAMVAKSPLARQLIYSLLTDEASFFEIQYDTAPDKGNNPCVLVSLEPLDYETDREYELVVRATDSVTGAFADAALTLRLIDVNDCAPEFEHDVYRASVSEAAEPGRLVITVRALDHDAGANGKITYVLSSASNEADVPFVVGITSGDVRVHAILDRELRDKYHLVVRAQDAGMPSLYTTAHLFITVEDVNDNEPAVERNVIGTTVSEQAERGAAVARVAAWDPDVRDASRLRYALVGAAHRALSLDSETGVLRVVTPSALSAAPRSLNVSVSDGAHATFARIKLSLAAVNRAAPRFPHVVHEARALENQPPPLLLTTVKAYDEDDGEYGTVRYSIPSAKLRDTFAIDGVSGALTTRVPLDRERRAEWVVPVLASDGGGLVRHTTVRVRVADLNDNAPAFPLREYRATVDVDALAGTHLITVTAADADLGDNSRLTYSLYESDAPGLFTIDPVSGSLSLSGDASAHASRALQVWVRARDGGGLAGEAPIRIYVLANGEQAPRLRAPPSDLFLREDVPPGTLLVDLRSEGGKTLEGVRLRLAPASAPDLFALDSAGRIVLAAQLDRETSIQHVIGVIIEGEGSPAPATMVQTRLHVLDVNEHAPIFHSQPYVIHLAENAPPHTSIVQLIADDYDSGINGEVRFSLADGDEEGMLFSIEPHTGWVTTLTPLDRETQPEHRIAVVASDGGTPRRLARGTLVVRLIDYNDCPPVFAAAEIRAEVREDAAAGTVVSRLEVRDADAAAAPLSFFVAAGDERARFQLRASGDLYVARALDRELQSNYRLTVAATDGKFTAYAVVHVSVLDVNDNPPYCVRARYNARLAENVSPGTLVAQLQTEDADEPENARLRYFLTGDNAHHFAIDKETGEVRVARVLDRETVPRYKVTAHAQDRDRPQWNCTSEVVVVLDDINDNAPQFTLNTYSVTMPEDADTGTLVVKVHASDADLGPNRIVRYSFVEEAAAFELAADTGVVTLRGVLDREKLAEHRLVVIARDSGNPSRTGTAVVRLTVADVNDNPPEFEFHQYRATIPELDAPGTEVLRVRATSRDAGVNADVHYSLVAGEDRDDFTMDHSTGALSIAHPLDHERRDRYLLTVQALDGGSPPLSDLATLNLTIADANDNAPRFTETVYTARIREDASPGASIVQLVANDADSGDNGRVRYLLVRGDPAGLFNLDPDTGRLVVAAQLDRETVPMHVLEVRARDVGVPELESSCTVRIEVLDANDNPPLFAQSNYSVVVPEDRPLGHSILKLDVEDADGAPNAAPFTFDFQSGNEMGAFRLEQDGHLRSAARFNHRIRDWYELRMRVFDNGTPPLFSDATVYVRIIEESQYPPAVTPLEIVVNSFLDEFPGGVIGRVFASDRDSYDTLEYSLAPADGAPYPPTDLFTIDAADGTLRAAPRLDVGEYRLNVTVADGKFLSFAIIRVAVVLVSEETLDRAVVVRFREVTDRDFILSHRKGFVRAVAEATDTDSTDVLILSVQRSEEPKEMTGIDRVRRQVPRDLDVAFAVRSSGGFLLGDALRRRLHAHLERLEERARLIVEELVRVTCVGGCGRGSCTERVRFRPGPSSLVATEVFALVAPAFRLSAECVCEPGHVGDRCEVIVSECVRCQEREFVAQFAGDGYLAYRVERGIVAGARLLDDELAVSVRFRTRRERGTLLATAGRVDYAVLEVAEGYLQFRMELGSGPAMVRAAVPVADGAWHEARLERRGTGMRLTVDRRSAHAQTPPPASVLDTRADRLLVGAELQRHAHAFAAEQVTFGFEGCITELKLGGSPLPLEEGGTSTDGHAQLIRRVRVRVGSTCEPLAPPSPCSSYPCQNGGTCGDSAELQEGDGEGYSCTCHARFSGLRCEVDLEPCASQPCLHGGSCEAEARGYRCSCAVGLTGERCERGRWCVPDACEHGGVCEEGDRGPSCRCRGYYGPRCQFDVDECAGEPCLNGATCLNEPGSFRCLCPPDKTGMNCGNPLYSDAVVAGGAMGGGRALADVWRWACEARWPLAVAGIVLALLFLVGACVPIAVRRARQERAPPPEAEPLNKQHNDKLLPRAQKLSNLEAVRRERPTSCADRPPLNNVDTLRSYGSAGDELEGIPPDYRRNLNIDAPDRKPWSEQMHLHTFVDNKIYNDLKGRGARPRPRSPHLVGGYHWDCSDWCGGAGALPGISEVAGSERPDSSSPASPPSPVPTLSPARFDSDSPADDVPHPDEYMPRVCDLDPDAASLITMLEERRSLLFCEGDTRSCGSLSARLCEIEDSDADVEAEGGDGCPLQTDV